MKFIHDFIIFLLAFLSLALASPVADHTSAVTKLIDTEIKTAEVSAVEAAPGAVTIVNHLRVPVYLWSVDTHQGPMITLEPMWGAHKESYRFSPNPNGGVSIKIAAGTPDINNVLQFEYTRTNDKVFRDMSTINLRPGSEFVRHAFALIPGDMSNCPMVECRSDDCPGVYHKPNDDHATYGCPVGVDMMLMLGY